MAQWRSFGILVLWLVLVLVKEISPHSDGTGIESACTTMVPGHGVFTQTTPSPYTISFTPSSYTPGTPVSVTLTSCTSTGFKGFLIQARRADKGSNQDQLLGYFGVIPNTRQTCNGNAALVHANSIIKNTLTFNWYPPPTAVGHVHFRATFVQDGSTFWAGVKSDILLDASDSTPVNSNTFTTPSSLDSSCGTGTGGGSGGGGSGSSSSSSTASPGTDTIPTLSNGNFIKDPECGSSKQCFSDCTPSGGCTLQVAWQETGDQGRYTLTAKVQTSGVNAWVALGFSADKVMGQDSVSGCWQQNSGVTVFGALNEARFSKPTILTDEGLLLVESKSDNGIFTCTFLRKKVLTVRGTNYNITQPWHLMVARGSIDATDALTHHGREGKIVSDDKFTLTPGGGGTTASGSQTTTTQPMTQRPSAGTVSQDVACGQTKGCFTDCAGSSCSFAISWMEDGNSSVFTVTSTVVSNAGAWVAIGFSDDDKMGGDSVTGCMSNSDETVQLFNGQNTGKSPPVLHTDNEVTLEGHRNEDGVLTCTFRRPNSASADGKRYDLSQSWTLLFARGATASGSLSYHGQANRFASSQKFALSSKDVLSQTGSGQPDPTAPAPSGSVSKDTGCGVTKGCFTDCTGASCSYVVSWMEDGDFGTYTLTSDVASDTGAWVAVGFSTDDKMGGDAVTGCVSRDDGTVQVFTGQNTGKSPTLHTDNEVTLVTSKNEDGILSCAIKQPKAASANVKRVDVAKPWTLLFARGRASFSANGVINLAYHNSNNRFVSPSSYRISDKIDSVAKKLDYPLIKAHGSLMVGAWIFFASVGLVAARYYKPVWKDMLCSQKVWFQIHRTCMILVFSATVAGFVIIFVEVEGWSDLIESKEHLEAHPIMGVIVTGLTVLNPIMALFRPHPGTPNRPIFNWAHWFVGTAAHVLGVITIFFGVQLAKADGPDYLVYILAGYVAWQLLIELILEIISCYGRRKDRKEIYEMSGTEAPKASLGTESDGATSLKRVLFVIHCFVVAALAAVVIAIIAVGESDLD